MKPWDKPLYSGHVKQDGRYTDHPWRKSRLAARILARKADGRMTRRDQRLAILLSRDREVSDRLIQQALYYLMGGHHKNEIDRGLGLVGRKS